MMEKNLKAKNITGIFNIVCAVLMLVAIVSQFLPYWNFNGEDFSIGGYTWFPKQNRIFPTLVQAELGEPMMPINSFVLFPVLIFVISALSVVMAVVKNKMPFSCYTAFIVGILGLVSFLTNNVLMLGTLWIANVILYAVILVVGAVGSYFALTPWLKKRKNA